MDKKGSAGARSTGGDQGPASGEMALALRLHHRAKVLDPRVSGPRSTRWDAGQRDDPTTNVARAKVGQTANDIAKVGLALSVVRKAKTGPCLVAKVARVPKVAAGVWADRRWVTNRRQLLPQKNRRFSGSLRGLHGVAAARLYSKNFARRCRVSGFWNSSLPKPYSPPAATEAC